MSYYKSFNAEALELSKTLPEEQNELYKRHFVSLKLESFADMFDQDGGPEEEKALKELSDAIYKNLQVRFDLLVGSTKHIVNNSKAEVRVLDANQIEEGHLADKMHRSKDDKFIAYIHAHTKKLMLIEVPQKKNVVLNILFANTDAPLATQVLINTGRESQLEIFEWYASKTDRATIAGVMHEVKIGPYAKAEINMIHNEDANTHVVGFTKGRVKENGHLKVNYVYNGGLNVRARNEIAADGYAAKSDVIEMVMGSAEQKFDLNTIIANVEQDTVSDLESKAALMDNSMCVLKGFADVGENARGSRSFVNERGILLDRTTYMSSIPGMSINNSNVKATHSSATAPVDEDSLFYLMCRGANEIAARKLLVAGFFSKSIAKMENPIVKAAVASLMLEKINNRKFGTIPKHDVSTIWFDPGTQSDMFEGHYKYRSE